MNSKTGKAIHYLKKQDKVLAKLILKFGAIRIVKRKNHFESLVRSIVAQQLSTKAASTIYNRFITKIDSDVTPEAVSRLQLSELRLPGISNQKGEFILSLASFVIDNPDFFKNLSKLDNDNVVQLLTSLRGIGEWTAQMFLIFSLGRMDILPLNDAGIQRSIKYHYKLAKKPTHKVIKKIALNWGDYSSVAAIYLWKGIDE